MNTVAHIDCSTPEWNRCRKYQRLPAVVAPSISLISRASKPQNAVYYVLVILKLPVSYDTIEMEVFSMMIDKGFFVENYVGNYEMQVSSELNATMIVSKEVNCAEGEEPSLHTG